VVTGIACGSGLGAVIVPQLVQPWIEHYGWRVAYIGMGAIVLIWAFPILFFLLREPRAEERVVTTADPLHRRNPQQIEGLEIHDAVRTGTFWLIAVAMYFAPFGIVGTLAHLFPRLTERGASAAAATTV